MALVLSRKLGEGITVDGPATFTVTRIGGGKNRYIVTIEADKQVRILRTELMEDRDGLEPGVPAERAG